MELDGQAFAVRHFSVLRRKNGITSVLIIFEAQASSNGDAPIKRVHSYKRRECPRIPDKPTYEKCITETTKTDWFV